MPRRPASQIAAVLDLSEGEALTLRLQARADPVRGDPMPTPAGPVMPGKWQIAFENEVGLPADSPVIALGRDGATYYFLDPLGGLYALQAKSSGKGEIDSLFAGRPLYVEWAWPRFAKVGRGDNERWEVRGYQADECRRDLFAACAYKGVFDPDDKVRGRGAWLDDAGGFIYHAGDAVFVGGAWRRPGEHGRHIYPVRPRIGRPVALYEAEGPGSPGDAVLELLRTWRWERDEVDARLALGWAMCAKIGGALDQRPVAYLSGEEGTGKTALQALFRGLMNGALMKTENTTQAGIYQSVRQDSIAILVDEGTEAGLDERKSDKLLELARIAYSGGQMNRGDKDGVGRTFTLRSSFIASSIAMPGMDAQDASRMALLVLRTLPADVAALEMDLAQVDLWGRQLLRRLFDWFPRWGELRKRFRAALIAVGHDSRSADTFAPLAAGAHVALFDDFPSPEELAQWSTWLKADKLEETANKKKTWRRCFETLLLVQPRALEHSNHKSVHDILMNFRDTEVSADTVNKALAQVGLALSFVDGQPEVYETARLFVPANHPGLHELFKGTAWAGKLSAPGPWSAVLRQAPREYWENGKCGRGLDKKASGLFLRVAAMLEG